MLWGWCLELGGRIHLWIVNCPRVTLAGGSCDPAAALCPAAALPCWTTLPESFKHNEHRRKEKNQVWLAHYNECSRRWASYKMLMTWSRQKHRKEKQRLCDLFVFLQEFSAASLMVFPFPPQRSEAKTLAIQNCTVFFAIQLFARIISAWRQETVILRKTRFSTCVVRCMKKKQISQAKVVASAGNRNSYLMCERNTQVLTSQFKNRGKKSYGKMRGEGGVEDDLMDPQQQ